MSADAAGRRATLTLDGLWDFQFEGPTARLAGEGQIRSPGIWQAQFPALRNAHGTGRYRRGVQIPPGWRGKSIVLVMEKCAFHESGKSSTRLRLRFMATAGSSIEVDLTDALDGKTVRARRRRARPRRPQRRPISAGRWLKQDRHGVQGGILEDGPYPVP